MLGPGYRWPYSLLPVYWLLERLPRTRGSAQRLGLVTLDQMVAALVAAVEAPAASRIVEVPDIRATPVERERRQARNATFFVARLACSACLAFPHRDHTRINTPCAGRPVACAIADA